MDLALNNLQMLICHKTKQTKPNLNIAHLSKNIMNHTMDQNFIWNPCMTYVGNIDFWHTHTKKMKKITAQQQ